MAEMVHFEMHGNQKAAKRANKNKDNADELHGNLEILSKRDFVLFFSIDQVFTPLHARYSRGGLNSAFAAGLPK
jgi:hypothetical protein